MKLIVLRGNSGSGKSTVARELRRRLGHGVALVEQDYLGRTALGTRLTDDGTNADLIELVTGHALRDAPAVVLEGILSPERYGEMLRRLAVLDGVQSWFYAFDLSLDETVARHATRGLGASFGEEELRRWFTPYEPLPGVQEQRIGPADTAEQLAERIIAEAGLSPGRPLP
ncbi:AAA family ATPase [Leifsonia sp. F6_8S_P_1B]|uniref:AAA family ATPase n=1 Tax=Leifsonia williamsii TaxID=3035919 RepID=A0ABT8KG84_9MICO|nr:AAA family ATPase [Leifsonia williamsii]MDN4615497.1 AAA family ATPase [Leifsonia williamsii]